jgi:hypothetical protein
MDRESFTLLNLTASESESVPDLDLVLPASRKQNKRKVSRNIVIGTTDPSSDGTVFIRTGTDSWITYLFFIITGSRVVDPD